MLFLNHIYLIPLLPAFAAAVMFFFGRKLRKQTVSAVCVGAVILAFIMACGAVWEYPAYAHANPEKLGFEKTMYTWLGTDTGHMNYVKHDGTLAPFKADVGFLLDPLSSIWLLFVTGVGMLIHIYSVGYMAHEGGYYRFFGYLNLFMFSMLMLILGNNYALMFVGWEGVGLCSYLLIGFYFQRKSASDAANKAFIVNRIGDAGFLLGMFTIAWYFGSVQFTTVNAPRAQWQLLPWADHIYHCCDLAFVCRRLRQVGAASALRLAARRDGRPHASFRPDPRRNHGHGGRVYGGAVECVVCAGAVVDESGRHHRRTYGYSSRLRLDWCRTTSSACWPTPLSPNWGICSWHWVWVHLPRACFTSSLTLSLRRCCSWAQAP